MSSTQAAALAASAAAVAFTSQSTALPAMDLTKVMERVARDNPDWSQQRLSDAERAYRQYWAVCKASPGGNEPGADADVIWHDHLQDNGPYMEASMDYFGYILVHNPAKSGELGRCPTCDDIDSATRYVVVSAAVN